MDKSRIKKESLILPHLIELNIPNFLKHSEKNKPLVLSNRRIKCEDWYYEFEHIVLSAMGKRYFPIMRMSDGEYIMMLGEKLPSRNGISWFQYFKQLLAFVNRNLIKKNIEAATLPGVSSGKYDKRDIELHKNEILNNLKKISDYGILALHLTYSNRAFQEMYHFSLAKLFKKNSIDLTSKNYYPFYFVYALLSGSTREKLFNNRNVLVIHSADGEKKLRITNRLNDFGVKQLFWREISTNKSMFDKLPYKDYGVKIDLILIGAGLGKINIIPQLEPYDTLCIDAGFVFEVWADESNKWKRPIMVTDDEWDEDKIKF
jgi:hypothetical protein